MPEIRTIGIPEVRVWMAEPPSVPQAPPVTLQLGVPVIDMPAFEVAADDEFIENYEASVGTVENRESWSESNLQVGLIGSIL